MIGISVSVDAKFGEIWERMKVHGLSYSQVSSYYQAYKLKVKASQSGKAFSKSFLAKDGWLSILNHILLLSLAFF